MSTRGGRIGWWLMGLPTGIHEPWHLVLRWGPYSLGRRLANRAPSPPNKHYWSRHGR